MESEKIQVKPASENGKPSLILLDVGLLVAMIEDKSLTDPPRVKTIQFLSGSLVKRQR